MVVFNGVKTENLWARYLNPKEDIFPAEIHELACGLLNTYENLIKTQLRAIVTRIRVKDD